jgi:hypothetical protein
MFTITIPKATMVDKDNISPLLDLSSQNFETKIL